MKNKSILDNNCNVLLFTYGSNLHPVRLSERLPSARILDVTRLNSHRLLFHKRSHDGSVKCNLYYSGRESDCVIGAIYQIYPMYKSCLDHIEGYGNGYIDRNIPLQHQNREYECFTYYAQQSHIDEKLWDK